MSTTAFSRAVEELSVGQNPRDQALSAVQQTAPVQGSRPKRPPGWGRQSSAASNAGCRSGGRWSAGHDRKGDHPGDCSQVFSNSA